jgi:hypothetical protein
MTEIEDTEFFAWLDEAEKITDEATQGEWKHGVDEKLPLLFQGNSKIIAHWDNTHHMVLCGVNEYINTNANARYVAHYDPPTTRKMITELRRMHARIRELEAQWIEAQMMAIEDMARDKEGEQ